MYCTSWRWKSAASSSAYAACRSSSRASASGCSRELLLELRGHAGTALASSELGGGAS